MIYSINKNELDPEQQISLRALCERCHTVWLPNTKCNTGTEYQQSAHIFPHQNETLQLSMRHPENCDGIPLNTQWISLYGYNKSFFSFPPLTLRGKFIFPYIERQLNIIKTLYVYSIVTHGSQPYLYFPRALSRECYAMYYPSTFHNYLSPATRRS